MPESHQPIDLKYKKTVAAWEWVCYHLVPEQILKLSTHSKQFLGITRSTALWRNKYAIHFPLRFADMLVEEAAVGPSSVNWFKEFWLAYKKELGHLNPEQRELFSLVKERHVSALSEKFCSKFFKWQDSDKKSLFDWIIETGCAPLIDSFHAWYKEQLWYKDRFYYKVLVSMKLQKPKEKIIRACEQYRLEDGTYRCPVTEGDVSPIHAAARAGRVDIVRHYLQLHPEWLNRRFRRKTPLQIAARYGHLEVVKELVALGAEINAVWVEGKNALALAIMRGHLEIVIFLMQHNIDLSADIHSKSPAAIAAQSGRVAILQLLLQHTPAWLTMKDSIGSTLLIFAATYGHTIAVKFLLRAGVSIDAKTNNSLDHPSVVGKTALQHAVMGNHQEVVWLLCEAGANPSLTDSHLYYTLQMALSLGGRFKVADLLLTLRPNMIMERCPDGQSLMSWALRYWHYNTVNMSILKWLLKNGATLASLNPFYDAPSNIAHDIFCGRRLQEHANKRKVGLLLLDGLLKQYPEIMNQSYPLDPVITLQEKMELVVLKNYAFVARYLFKHFACQETVDKSKGVGAWDNYIKRAVELKHTAILKVFLEFDPGLLLRAAATGDEQVVSFFLENGFDFKPGAGYQDILDMAVQNDQRKIVELVVNHQPAVRYAAAGAILGPWYDAAFVRSDRNAAYAEYLMGKPHQLADHLLGQPVLADNHPGTENARGFFPAEVCLLERMACIHSANAKAVVKTDLSAANRFALVVFAGANESVLTAEDKKTLNSKEWKDIYDQCRDGKAPLSMRDVRQELIIRLERYIKRIEKHDLQHGFSIFKKTQAANRQKNLIYAKYVLGRLIQNMPIEGFFKDLSQKRMGSITESSELLFQSRPKNIRSNELNKIIKTGRQYQPRFGW